MTVPLTQEPQAEPLPTASAAGVIVDGRYLPPPKDEDGKQWVRTSAVVQADPQKLYEMWHDIEAAPAWQEQIVGVVKTGEKTSRWTMKSGDKTVEWDSEILADEPGRRIAWRSISGEPSNAGEVVFEAAPGGRGTVVILLQEFGVGKFASAWETLVGRNPKQAVIEDLRHFKALAETGEIPRIQGQAHGERGLVGGVKQSIYGEKVTTPPTDEVRKAS